MSYNYHTKPGLVLIDDDEDDLEMMSSSLCDLGFLTTCFADGLEAVHYLEQVERESDLPALITLDYNMPVRNGLSILMMLKVHEKLKEIPVVIYTTFMSPFLEHAFLTQGAEGCFTKPNTWAEHQAVMAEIGGLVRSQEVNRSTGC